MWSSDNSMWDLKLKANPNLLLPRVRKWIITSLPFRPNTLQKDNFAEPISDFSILGLFWLLLGFVGIVWAGEGERERERERERRDNRRRTSLDLSLSMILSYYLVGPKTRWVLFNFLFILNITETLFVALNHGEKTEWEWHDRLRNFGGMDVAISSLQGPK